MNAPIGAWCTSTGTAMPGMFDSVVNFKMLDNADTFNQNICMYMSVPLPGARFGLIWQENAEKG